MKTLVILHTTQATLDPLKTLAGEILPGCRVINYLDDSILPQLMENGGRLDEVEERMFTYARFAEQSGADVILNACSSVGELVEKMRKQVKIPVVRIDEAMAEEAVCRGKHIGVAATLPTTLKPTLRLLEQKAAGYHRKVRIKSVLLEEAYWRLAAGDKEGHDRLLAESLLKFVRNQDVVVLAQATMAQVVRHLPEVELEKFLSSPRLGMEQVEWVLERRAHA